MTGVHNYNKGKFGHKDRYAQREDYVKRHVKMESWRSAGLNQGISGAPGAGRGKGESFPYRL